MSQENETDLLTNRELDAVVGGVIDVYLNEVACPIGHLSVIVMKDNGVQVGVGVRYFP